ncbi:FecCD family ABC transporter permease [Reinekea thalattae]|uniref:FecCD family ABC transporter permease n=1 Tax=Reinekea thalattae TaxID=2593301 RepID=UPI001FE66E3C|nr:iron ABC transporter permease [Reinekea thalattae]
MKNKRESAARYSIGGLCLAIIFCTGVSVGVGPMPLSIVESFQAILTRFFSFNNELPQYAIVVVESIRLPRTLLGLVVGATLAVSGAAIQGLFRNPLADPGLIGVSSGAALAAVASIVLAGSILKPVFDLFGSYTLSIMAFLGGLGTTCVVAWIATSRFGTSITTMLLAGIAINIACGSGIGILTYLADDTMLRTLTFWQMGSLGGATWTDLSITSLMCMVTLICILRYSKQLNALLLGESEARHLGVNVDAVKFRIILLVALGVGAAVAVSGMIGFVGLVVPHIVRMSLGPDHRYLLPASALLGGLFLVLADMLSRTLIAPAELPIGLITAIIGGPFFIALIALRSNRGAL